MLNILPEISVIKEKISSFYCESQELQTVLRDFLSRESKLIRSIIALLFLKSTNESIKDEHYRIIDCSDKPSYLDVPSCVKVTGRVSLNRAADLINDVLKNFEVPENKKYVSGYSYSKEIIEEYKKSLQETTV